MKQKTKRNYYKKALHFFSISTYLFFLLTSSALADREYRSMNSKSDKLNYSDYDVYCVPSTQIAAYTANISAANRMFMQDNNHNHINNTSLWLDISQRRLKKHQMNRQTRSKNDMSAIQLGNDIFEGSFRQQDKWKIGITGGYGKADISTSSQFDSYITGSNVKGYTGGVYSSLEHNTQQDNTFQLTGSVHYSHYKNDIDYANFYYIDYEENTDHPILIEEYTKERYNSSGWIVNMEAQYSMDFYKNDETHLLLEPHIQIHWAKIKMKAFTDLYNNPISKCHKGFISTRSGFGLYANNKLKSDGLTINPFLEADIFTFSDECRINEIMRDRSVTAGQIKLGLTSYVGKDISFKITLSNLKGSHDYQQSELNLGGIWSF